MALAFDAASSTSGTNVSSLTWSHTCTGTDRLLFVGTGNDATSGNLVSSVTYASITLTERWDEVVQTFVGHSGSTLAAPATGANNIVVTYAAQADDAGAGGTSFTGVDQTTSVGTAATANGASGTSTVDASSATDDVVVDNIWCDGASVTVGAGQTSRWEQDNVGGFSSGGGSTEPGAATVTMSWTRGSNSFWAIGAISIKPAAATAITLDMWLGSRPDLEPPRRRLIPIDGFKIPPEALTQGESVLIDKWNRLTPDKAPPLRKLQPAEYGYFTIPEWALTQGETVLLDKWLGYYPSVLFRAQKSYEGFFDFPWEAIIPAVVITPDMWLGHHPDTLFRAQKSYEGFFNFPWGVLVGAPEDVTLDKWLGTYPAFIVPRRFRAAWTGHFAFVSRINQTDLWGPAGAGDGFVAIICGDF